MARKTDREKFTESITVQARECENFVLVPRSFLTSLGDEINNLRAQLGLPSRAIVAEVKRTQPAEPPA